MKKVIVPEKFKGYVSRQARFMNGDQIRVTFPNGYGASIINHDGSYGLEMAVLWNDELCYSTPITDDVLGHLTQEELEMYLQLVMDLEV